MSAGPLIRDADGFLRRADGFRDPAAPPATGGLSLPPARTLIERLYHIVDALPDRPAIDDGARVMTYSELGRHVARFVQVLARQPEGPAAIVTHNTLAFPAVMLALLASGRPFTPIDASHPLDRQAGVFDQVQPALVITTTPAASDLSFVPASTPVLHLDLDDGAPPAPRPVLSSCDPDAPSGLVFTSGSTGRPKGVAGTQRGYVNTLSEYVDACAINQDDVILSIATLSAIGAREILAAVFTGATVRVLDFKAEGLMGALKALGQSTVLSFAPSVMRTVMGVPGIEAYSRSLRVLSLLGEPVLASDVRMFREKLAPDARICVEFGTTETTCPFRWFVRDDILEAAATPSGYLAPGYAVMLADADGRPVPDGDVGELVVRSVSVARGLWVQGSLTPGPFITDDADTGVRTYATGDLMRLRPDGLFEFIGRRDRMIKVRGLQVDLAEVETALFDMVGVEDAVALAVDRTGAASELVAFIAGNADLEGDPMRRQIRLTLAEHMTPARIIVIEAIPRLPNFKPDLVRLTALAGG